MSSSDDSHASRVRRYYEATTEDGYLRSWASEALGFHFGLADDDSVSHSDSLLEANRVVAARAQLRPGSRVLDAGCGVGGSAIWLADTLGIQVVGVSIDPNQVKLAAEFAASRGVSDRVRFVVADLQADQIDGGPFDVIWHIESFCHLDDPTGYLKRAVNLLADGGRIVSLDLHRGESVDDAACQAMCEGWLLPELTSIAEMSAMLEAAGLAETSVEDLTHRTLRSAERLLAMASQRLMMLEMKRVMLGVEDPIYEGHTRAAIGAARGLSSGTVRYGLVSAAKVART